MQSFDLMWSYILNGLLLPVNKKKCYIVLEPIQGFVNYIHINAFYSYPVTLRYNYWTSVHYIAYSDQTRVVGGIFTLATGFVLG